MAHRGAHVVTDIEKRNVAGLRVIAKYRPELRTRIVPQIYHPREYKPVANLGYDRIVWTLYRVDGSNDKVLAHVADMGVYAVTMPKDRADRGLAQRLDKLGIPSYTHTVNRQAELRKYVEMGIDEIYTDFLGP